MKKFIVIGLLVSSVSAMAGECVITIDRKACPGKETDAFKPYNGKNPTEEKKSQDSAGACEKWAEKSAKIVRKGTLTEKKVTAKFDGKDVKGSSDKADCK